MPTRSRCVRPSTWRAALVVGLFWPFVAAVFPASAAFTTLVNNGRSTNRVDIVFLGDGYTQADLNAGLYTGHVQNYLDYMFGAGYLADPFPRYSKFFNVHKIDVVSSESGADHPSQGVFRNTALDASYDSQGIDRLLTISTSKANNVLNQNLSGSGITADIKLATVNDSQYGGSGGTWAVYAGANGDARDIALHELSHAFSGTLDEYVTNQGTYPNSEPSAVNVTKDASGQKWSRWLGFHDPRGGSLDIGVYQGAAFYPDGIYRASADSKMRTLGQPFNAVVREKSILDIYKYVDPLDSWLDNRTTIQGNNLWVDTVDPGVIWVDWFVNGELIAANHGEAFNLADYESVAGNYQVRAHAYDDVVKHANDGSLLDLVRMNYTALEQDVTWTVHFVPLLDGDYNLDGAVDDADFTVWKSGFGSNVNLAADGNDDGIVDAADYTIWRNNIGALAGGAANVAVPEPAAMNQFAVAVLGGLLVLRGRQRSRRPVLSICRCV